MDWPHIFLGARLHIDSVYAPAKIGEAFDGVAGVFELDDFFLVSA
jgi:hypothetical protein